MYIYLRQCDPLSGVQILTNSVNPLQPFAAVETAASRGKCAEEILLFGALTSWILSFPVK